ncbi:hypothetical protein J2847_002975 [Azospirillum agricola]|uniref:hypothetical protein n=1 Tax=Azospirillum agricola TaxID=1720247 RepID=UPI001AE1FDEF|nr:hypothetical protein [Azospirillum agricola]MBP2229676.1 hypothetical protein [Azospirillum agricola]
MVEVPSDNPLDVPEIRAPNRNMEKGELGEAAIRLALQKEYPDYYFAPVKDDGVTGPDIVMVPYDPSKPLKIIEVKAIDNSSRAGNPTRYLKDTRAGKQASKQYSKAWAKKVIEGRRSE